MIYSLKRIWNKNIYFFNKNHYYIMTAYGKKGLAAFLQWMVYTVHITFEIRSSPSWRSFQFIYFLITWLLLRVSTRCLRLWWCFVLTARYGSRSRSRNCSMVRRSRKGEIVTMPVMVVIWRRGVIAWRTKEYCVEKPVVPAVMKYIFWQEFL